ncbi:serine hydrolase domain-containing protein [Fructilactobacillus sp. Tb1]|uniref:serine hydrolase domain-containing protein n=1 Tax=Fructilactobacillus sp. Tb1 TaxID=3422304 RepID=UPI003D2CC57F
MSFERVKRLINQMINDEIVPGASYSFINGYDVEDNITGYKQLKPTKEVLPPNQLYDVASMTKVMGTVPVIMQLLQDEKIGLDDSITNYLPEWKYPKVTIRHLLTHTSDIEGYIPNRNEMNMNQLREALLGLHTGPNFGKKMKYQDANYIFLGWIAGVVTGLPIQPLIKHMVFSPLGMIDSTFHPDSRRTIPTTYNEETGTNRVAKVHDPKARILGSDCGSAGMFSSQRDFDKFAQWMLQLTQPGKLYNKDIFDAMYHDQTPMQDGTRTFGWKLDKYQGHSYIWQTGYTGIVMVIVRDRRSAFTFLSNRVHPTVSERFIDVRQEMIDDYLEDLFN